eukprot:1891005-Rhodomonas_salina.1
MIRELGGEQQRVPRGLAVLATKPTGSLSLSPGLPVTRSDRIQVGGYRDRYKTSTQGPYLNDVST